MVQKIHMPEKLDWALEGLVRAVLLHQPEDIYLFAAQHFEKILRSRENSGDHEVLLKTYRADSIIPDFTINKITEINKETALTSQGNEETKENEPEDVSDSNEYNSEDIKPGQDTFEKDTASETNRDESEMQYRTKRDVEDSKGDSESPGQNMEIEVSDSAEILDSEKTAEAEEDISKKDNDDLSIPVGEEGESQIEGSTNDNGVISKNGSEVQENEISHSDIQKNNLIQTNVAEVLIDAKEIKMDEKVQSSDYSVVDDNNTDVSIELSSENVNLKVASEEEGFIAQELKGENITPEDGTIGTQESLSLDLPGSLSLNEPPIKSDVEEESTNLVNSNEINELKDVESETNEENSLPAEPDVRMKHAEIELKNSEEIKSENSNSLNEMSTDGTEKVLSDNLNSGTGDKSTEEAQLLAQEDNIMPQEAQIMTEGAKTTALDAQTDIPEAEIDDSKSQNEDLETKTDGSNRQNDPPEVKTDAPDTENDTPEVQTDAPDSQNDTPEAQTDSPDKQNDTPEVETDLPDSQNNTPEGETNAPDTQNDTPEEQTDDSKSQNNDLEAKTDIPEVQTDAPEKQNDTPEVQTDDSKSKNNDLEAKTDVPEVQTDATEIPNDSLEVQTDDLEEKPDSPEAQTGGQNNDLDAKTDVSEAQTNSSEVQNNDLEERPEVPDAQIDAPEGPTDTSEMQTDDLETNTDIPEAQSDPLEVQTDTPDEPKKDSEAPTDASDQQTGASEVQTDPSEVQTDDLKAQNDDLLVTTEVPVTQNDASKAKIDTPETQTGDLEEKSDAREVQTDTADEQTDALEVKNDDPIEPNNFSPEVQTDSAQVQTDTPEVQNELIKNGESTKGEEQPGDVTLGHSEADPVEVGNNIEEEIDDKSNATNLDENNSTEEKQNETGNLAPDETELKPDNEQGERDAEKSTNVPSSENDEKQGDSEELESTTVNSAENLGTEVPANLTDSASIQETIPSELTTVDNSNPQDRIERVKENGSANGTEFLRSSGEFHDMIVVLPDDTLNTTEIDAGNEDKGIEDMPQQKNVNQESPERAQEDEQAAATKIQASYRGYQTRKRLKKMPAETESSVAQDATVENPAGSDSVEESTIKIKDDPNNDDSKDLVFDTSSKEKLTEEEIKSEQEVAAATVIQASYRGYKTRKGLKQSNQQKNNTNAEVTKEESELQDDETNNDKDYSVNKEKEEAAIKIQAAARGYIGRKQIAKSHEAATTIQANYRGYRTRKNLAKQSNDNKETQ